jgi:hypothetical protein
VTLVIIDSGVFVAGVFWRNEAYNCVNAWLRGVVALGMSEDIYQEYERTLRKIRTRFLQTCRPAGATMVGPRPLRKSSQRIFVPFVSFCATRSGLYSS